MRLGSLLATSLIWALSNQYISLVSPSGGQMVLLYLLEESCLLLSSVTFSYLCWLLYGEQIELPYSAPVSLLMWQVFPLQCAEWLSSSARISQVSGKVSSSFWPLSLQVSIFLHYCPLSPFCMWQWGCFWLFGHGLWVQSRLHLEPFNSFSGFLMLCSLLLTTPCSLTTCFRRSSTWAHLLQAYLLPVPVPRKRSRSFLQSEVSTADSPFSNSACMRGTGHHWMTQTFQLELKPFLSDQCPPFYLEVQAGWVPLTFADGHPTVRGVWVMFTSSLEVYLASGMPLLWRDSLPSQPLVPTAMQTVSPLPGWCAMPCFPILFEGFLVARAPQAVFYRLGGGHSSSGNAQPLSVTPARVGSSCQVSPLPWWFPAFGKTLLLLCGSGQF